MELSRQLVEELTALEKQAAQVAALLDGASPELVDEVLAAFAPPPVSKGGTERQRVAWARAWLAWVFDCGYRYEQRPVGPSAEQLHRVIVRWAQR